MTNHLFDDLRAQLANLQAEGRHRQCQVVIPEHRPDISIEGEHLVSFASNDYLGLASHPVVIAAANRSALAFGVGVGSSRLLAGTFPVHRELERKLADLVRLPDALLFPTGYQANLGAITALVGPADLIVADRAVHASLIDAFKLSRAKLALYPHLDIDTAERHLRRLAPQTRRRLLVTESLFSMDGDAPDLLLLRRLATAHDAILYVDEAHSLGAFGPQGRGLCAEHGITPDILVGTLGKAFGASGAFVAGPEVLRSFLVNSARSFIFTTSLPAPIASAAATAIDIALSQEGDHRRLLLRDRVQQLRTQLGLPSDDLCSPIVPVLLGDNQRAIDVSSSLKSRGFFVPAIRPPTVRPGSSRLRISLSSLHTPVQVEGLCHTLSALLAAPSQPGPSVPSPNPENPRPWDNSAHPPQRIPSARGLFLVGTDTAVGKTAVAQALLYLLAHHGERVVPFKPMESGAASAPTDAQLLLAACDRSDLPLSLVCPYSFADPVAPAVAARASGLHITPELLSMHAAAAAGHGSFLLVESAGGLLSPYASDMTSADLGHALGLPFLLVARNSLGTVNHTALAVSEIRRRGLPLLGIILVDTSREKDASSSTNASLIADSVGIPPLGVLPFLPDPTPAKLAAALEANVDLGPLTAALLPQPSNGYR